MLLFVLIVAVPLIEIGLFVTLGGWLTLWPTLAWVLVSGVLGMLVLRGMARRGISLDMRGPDVSTMGDPLSPVAQAAVVMLAGILLILPGFLTDGLGLLLLLPPVRTGLIRLIGLRLERKGLRPASSGSTEVVDAEFIDLDPPSQSNAAQPGRPSGWTQD